MTGGDEGPRGFISGRITGAQTGAVLAFVSSGILGQYDPFGPNGGELLLVYPNVIAVERQLRVLPADFRLWVCLHEVTHRVQFRANPWLADHMSQSLAVLTEDAGEDVTAGGRPARGVASATGATALRRNRIRLGVLGLAAGGAVRAAAAALDQLLVLGTLLEGHADHVMDAVGSRGGAVGRPPSGAGSTTAASASSHRCSGSCGRCWASTPSSASTPAARRLSTTSSARVGMARFNTIWSSAETLPLPTEIDEPQRWIDRVL